MVSFYLYRPPSRTPGGKSPHTKSYLVMLFLFAFFLLCLTACAGRPVREKRYHQPRFEPGYMHK